MRTLLLLDGSAGSYCRGPGPLEVEATKVAGDVDYFADKIEAGDGACFHGAGLNPFSVYTSYGHFCFGEAFRAGRIKRPGVQAALASFKCCIRPPCGCSDLSQMLGEALRKSLTQDFEQCRKIAAALP